MEEEGRDEEIRRILARMETGSVDEVEVEEKVGKAVDEKSDRPGSVPVKQGARITCLGQ